jgi:hypothetical protein
MIRELHRRSNNGLTVTLYADFTDPDNVIINCQVQDVESGQDFTISDIPHDRVLEVFKHPFACGRKLLHSGAIPACV